MKEIHDETCFDRRRAGRRPAVPPAANAEIRRDAIVLAEDLDLGTKAGVAELDRRLAKAVLQVCGTAHYLDSEALDDLDRCRAAARGRAIAWRNGVVAQARERAATGGAFQ